MYVASPRLEIKGVDRIYLIHVIFKGGHLCIICVLSFFVHENNTYENQFYLVMPIIALKNYFGIEIFTTFAMKPKISFKDGARQ